jgi:flagellar biosynthetic protein FliQ
VNSDQAVAIIAALFRTTILVAAPVLVVALAAGILVGIIQTATQINEPSVSFLAKVTAVLLVGVALGSQLATYVIDYTRANFEAVAQVVR